MRSDKCNDKKSNIYIANNQRSALSMVTYTREENWLFADFQVGANANATMYYLIMKRSKPVNKLKPRLNCIFSWSRLFFAFITFHNACRYSFFLIAYLSLRDRTFFYLVMTRTPLLQVDDLVMLVTIPNVRTIFMPTVTMCGLKVRMHARLHGFTNP